VYLSAVTINGFRASATRAFTCRFPDRFSVLLGQNNAGKTTVCDALYLAHVHSFPNVRRSSSAVLGDNPRTIDIAFEFGGVGPEGPLGLSLLGRSEGPPSWTRRLERSLGSVRAVGIDGGQHVDDTRLIYLPAARNPVDELARREAEVLVELLRAEQERRKGHRNLGDVRALAAHLLDGLVAHELIQSVEARVSDYLLSLTGGVSKQYAFVGRQEIDDAFLARVLEFLLSSVDQRSMAQRLEVSGLGYVNLLHIAVTLAAVPGGNAVPHSTMTPPEENDGSEASDSEPSVESQDTEARIDAANAEAEAIEDSFFPELFHATIVIEEPEAHLHPQLQHGLMRYLRRVTMDRPELQVIVSTHSSEMMSACRPQDIVILRVDPNHERVARPVVGLPVSDEIKSRVLRLTALHFDAARSASLFAERLVLVEGVTDALVLRRFGHVWAGDDLSKRDFVDALTIVPLGSRVGEWTVQLLATPGYELATRVALLRDTDKRDGETPVEPTWMVTYDREIVRCFLNHPTLEPAITLGNESLVAVALTEAGISSPSAITPETIDALFHSGGGRGRKGEFAFSLAGAMEAANAGATPPAIPAHMNDLFDFLYPVDSGDEGENDVAPAAN
jgi:putative ATP-dependent endonuclease of OLD family